jgi:hypothetical protein
VSVWSDIWSNIQAFAEVTEGQPAQAGPDVAQTPEAQSAIQGAGFFGFVEGLLTALTDPGMWVSLGWLLLGIILIIAGVRMWMGKSPLPSPPSVVPVPL